ncbi:hypothetical protein OAG53_02605 [Akkermansiaceae bacterium]|nr:hypothetical protein [Akkermansiaceae bacterium]
MFSAKDLTEEQKEMIHGWVAEGAQMADIQKRLNEELKINVTYMDTRFLSLDLDLQYQSKEEEKPEPGPVVEEAAPQEDPAENSPAPQAPVTGVPVEDGGFQPVMVGLDTVARPGAMVSGTVTFSDGEKGRWMIDEMGRPSVDPDTPGYRPTEHDLMDFQHRLRDLLDGHA